MAKNSVPKKWLLPIAVLVMTFGSAVLTESMVSILAVALGVAIGWLNIGNKEKMPFVLYTGMASLLGFAWLNTVPGVGELLQNIVSSVVTVLAISAGIVALVGAVEKAKD
jgi:hypothetical protein